MLWYSLKKEDWNITIKKEQHYKNTGLIKYWLVKRDDCNNTFKEKVFAKTYTDNANVNEVNIDLQALINEQIARERNLSAEKDLYGQGVYELHFVLVESKKTGVEEKNERILGVEITKTFAYYPQILDSLVNDLENVLCGCPCSNCEGCIDDKKLLNVVSKTLLYYTLSGDYYSNKFGKALSCISCSLSKEAICILLNEQIRGGSELNKRFLKKILAIFYISFYLLEVGKDCSNEWNNTNFKFEKVKKCLEGLGIDINCIMKATENKAPTYLDFAIYAGKGRTEIIDYRYFIDNYRDDDEEPIEKIKIYNIENNGGDLQLNGVSVTENQIIDFQDVLDNKLTYIAPSGSGAVTAHFDWEASEGCQNRF